MWKLEKKNLTKKSIFSKNTQKNISAPLSALLKQAAWY